MLGNLRFRVAYLDYSNSLAQTAAKSFYLS
jgi:hypothetical protein